MDDSPKQEFENIVSTWIVNADRKFSSQKNLSKTEVSEREGYKKAISDLQLLIDKNQNQEEYSSPLAKELMSKGLRSLMAVAGLLGYWIIFQQNSEFRNTYFLSWSILIMIAGVTVSQWKSGMDTRFPVRFILLGILLYLTGFLIKGNVGDPTTFANDIGIEITGSALVGFFLVSGITKNKIKFRWPLIIFLLGVGLAINISMLLNSFTDETFRVTSLIGIEMIGAGYTTLLLTITSNTN